jgi:hypothetical protein
MNRELSGRCDRPRKPADGLPTGRTPYPVQFSVDYPDRDLNQMPTAFRIFTVIPTAIVLGAVSGGTCSGPMGTAAPRLRAAGFLVVGGLLAVPGRLSRRVIGCPGGRRAPARAGRGSRRCEQAVAEERVQGHGPGDGRAAVQAEHQHGHDAGCRGQGHEDDLVQQAGEVAAVGRVGQEADVDAEPSGFERSVAGRCPAGPDGQRPSDVSGGTSGTCEASDSG